MKTEVVQPHDIFYRPKRMVVPLFQRPYVWSKETQWQPLWQDIARLIDVISKHDPNATHFLGAIVIQQVPTALGALQSWNVIDGQQRLTTLQLLLGALHAELTRRGFSNAADRIHPLIENPEAERDAAEDRYKVWPTNRDRPAFAAVMSAPAPIASRALPASRMRDAHRFFAETIGEWLGEDDDAERRARSLADAVTTRLEIASISLDANEDAQAIFETLNARGTPLSAADLIKNFVFQQLPEKEAEAAYQQYWADFETPWWEAEVTSGRIKNTRSSLFMWQWLVARTLEDFPIREVFTQFKHYVSTVAKDIRALLPQIKRAADRYRAVIEGAAQPVGALSRTELFSYRIGALNTDVARPLLIWLDEPEQGAISDEDRKHILVTLESWFVRRALVKATSQASNRIVVDLMRRLSAQASERVADEVRDFLAESQATTAYWPGDTEVRAVVRDARAYTSYRQSVQRMIFEALEDDKRGYPDGRAFTMGPIVRGKATIEHVMPQKWRQHWFAELSEEEQATRDWRIQQLGNLTIVTQSLNTRVSNGPWEQKREHFLRSDDVLITKDAINLVDDSGWDERAIGHRTEQLIDRILELWPVPEGHVGRAETKPATSTATVDVAQLVDAGWLDAGTLLVPGGSYFRKGVEATISQDGRIYVGDAAYDYPSAAGYAVHGSGVNGWWYWAIAGTEQRLLHVREEYLASVDGSDAGSDEPDEEMEQR
ncbi:GmrSD restriction endonuclease domain-containing protein [Microbacterium sp. JB110]|uniref:GmrSD restriction endonuclease domain-containing protein n=1 Tax=Microbacterium sp. JB110 TaxID=2024477 RepID=UPI00097F0286|nr:DUF262 domain-containing protein [Microbacterium sp. JB110]RCS58821.1 DUF262 domain-containing protein [Microbacterium sp. JB110]SJM54789.1 protein of unknown function DUF1524 RloF [Frigoribacterium sp. JB110]